MAVVDLRADSFFALHDAFGVRPFDFDSVSVMVL
jgi:hypothetical protein